MSKGISKLCTKKKLLYKRFKKSGSLVAEQQFKECNSKLKKPIRRSHINYLLGISKTARSNPKNFWNYIIRSSTKDSSQLSFSIDDGDITDPFNIAHAFKNNFSSKFGTSPPVDLNDLPDYSSSHGGASFSFEIFLWMKLLIFSKCLTLTSPLVQMVSFPFS